MIQYVTNRQFVIDQLRHANCILAADDGYMLMADNKIHHLSLETMRDIRPLLERIAAPYPTVFWLSEAGIKILQEQDFWREYARRTR